LKGGGLKKWKMTKIHSREEIKKRRKELRNNATDAEKRLWLFLKKKQLCNRKFSRQHSIGKYIVDFYCFEERLIIEVDGVQHYEPEQKTYDDERTKILEALNHKVIRFSNMEVLFDTDNVLKKIEKCFYKK
jgi:very-short-patch-repair endonuclease